MIYFRILAAFFENFKYNIGLGGFRNLNCIVFFVVKVYPILVMTFAHLARKGSPLNDDSMFVLPNVELLA